MQVVSGCCLSKVCNNDIMSKIKDHGQFNQHNNERNLNSILFQVFPPVKNAAH